MKSRDIISGLLALVVMSLLFYSAFSFFNPGDANELFISTTTSVENTGLLDFLVGEFEKATEYEMKYTAVGSGAAIQLARDGEVDAVLVHAQSLENELYADGFVLENTTLWYNYFTIIGPEDDPAGIKDVTSASEAMALIKTAGEAGLATFYSRGDNSGTHVKELSIWNAAGIAVDSSADWYFETGTGMSTTITTAEEDTKGYVLTDLGTYAVLKDEGVTLEKVPLMGSDPVLYNPYSYHVIDESAFEEIDLNTEAAQAFLDFLEDPETVQKVRDFTVGGQILFTPIGG